MGPLVGDGRLEAVRALAKIGSASLDVFLNILQDRDRYAKESICEEAERTYFIQWLITNLLSSDAGIYDKSRGILKIMHALNFSTPLREYLRNGEKDEIKREITLLIEETVSPAGGPGARTVPDAPCKRGDARTT